MQGILSVLWNTWYISRLILDKVIQFFVPVKAGGKNFFTQKKILLKKDGYKVVILKKKERKNGLHKILDLAASGEKLVFFSEEYGTIILL